ncbi:MAG TPA: SulP family inorganic anion transporter, partial [Thermoanaerobaculia bacterium]
MDGQLRAEGRRAPRGRLAVKAPFLPNWISAYRKDWLRPDVIAGLTAAAIVIPKAMAYATIAG